MDKKISVYEIAKKIYETERFCYCIDCKNCEFYKKGTTDYTCWSLAIAVELRKYFNVDEFEYEVE